MLRKIKITTILLLTLLLVNCDQQPTVEEVVDNVLPQPPELNTMFRNKSDPFQMLNLGYKLNIGMVRGETNMLFDYTELGIDDSYKGKAQISALYYPSNDASGALSKFQYGTNVSYNSDVENYDWRLISPKGHYNKPSNIKYFKQIYAYAECPNVDFITVIKRSSVEFYYAPDTNAYPVFKYYLKGFNNGSGQVEVVGWTAKNPDGTEEIMGDTNIKAPYVPSGYAPPATNG